MDKIRTRCAFISHKISGDVKGNLDKIASIIREINLNEGGVVPFAPYFADIAALDDEVEEERSIGMGNCLFYIENKLVDSVRFYGDTLSYGMSLEAHAAYKAGVQMVAMTEETYTELIKIFNPQYIQWIR